MQRIEDDKRRMELVRRAWRVPLHSVLYAVVLTVFLVAVSAWLPWEDPGRLKGQPPVPKPSAKITRSATSSNARRVQPAVRTQLVATSRFTLPSS